MIGPRAASAPAKSTWWRRRARWQRWTIVGIPVAFVLYTALGFLGVPLLLRHLVVPQVGKSINGTIALRDAQCNPYTFELGLDDLDIRDDLGRTTIGFHRFDVNFELWRSLFKRGWHYQRVRLQKPILKVETAKDGSFNLASLFKADPDPKPSKPLSRIPRVVVDALAVEDGTIDIADLSLPEPFGSVVSGLTFTLDDLDTTPENENAPHLVATTETGARLEWDGVVFADPFSSRGTIVATGLRMERFMPYALRYVDAKVSQGELDFRMEYEFLPLREPRVATAKFPSIELREVKVDHRGESLATAPKLSLTDVVADATNRSLSIKELLLRDGTLLVQREASGSLNIAELVRVDPSLPAPAAGSTPEPPPASPPNPQPDPQPDQQPDPQPDPRIDPRSIPYPIQQLLTAISYLVQDAVGPWSLDLQRIEIAGQSIDAVDLAVEPEVRLPLRETTLVAGPMRSADGFRIPFAVGAHLLEHGRAEATGVLGVAERTIEATLLADKIELATGAPYLALLLSPPLDTPSLRSGLASLEIKLTASAPRDARATLGFSGPVRLEAAELVRGTDGIALLAADSLLLDGKSDFAAAPDGAMEGRWNGELRISGMRGGEPLMDTLGLGSGGASVGALELKGSSTASRLGDVVSAAWDGTISLEGVSGKQVGLGGPTDLELASFRLQGKATAKLGERDAGQVAWDGTVAMGETSFRAAERGLDLRLRDATIAGAAQGTFRSAAESLLAWKGEATVHGAATELGLAGDATRAAASSLSVRGDLAATLGDAIAAQWTGAVTSEAPEAAGTGWSVGSATLAIDGTSEGRFDEALRIAWRGTIESVAPKAGAAAAGGIEFAGERLLIDGAVSSPPGDPSRFEWKGEVSLARPKLLASDLRGPVELAADALTVDGTAAATTAGSLEHDGALEISGATLSANEVLGQLAATLRALRIDGSLRVRPGESASELGWKGNVLLSDGTVKGGGEQPLDLTLERVSAEGDLSGRGGGADAALDWSGSTSLGRVGGRAAGAEVGLGGAEAKGDLTVSDGGAAGWAAKWAGALAATEPRFAPQSADGGPSNTFGAQSIQHDGGVGVRSGDAFDLTATGELSVAAARAELGVGVVDVGRIAAAGVDLQHAAGTLGLASLAIEQPVVTARMAASPATSSAPEESGAAPSVAPSARGKQLAAQLPYQLAIGSMTVRDGRIEVRDEASVPPHANVVDEIRADATNISTAGAGFATLDASARVQGSGRFEAVGRASVFEDPPSGDLKITITGVPMPPLSPISGRWAGFLIDNGRLSSTLPITVQAGKVDGTLEFLLDKLKLGKKVESPDATKLPLDLGLSLLRDANDQVKGKVPFQGDMSDPKFSFGGLIWQAVLSLLGKVITAPFQLIAGAFGGSANMDLSFVGFEPGKSELTAEALSKLDVLGKGLVERPQMRFQVDGRIARDADIAALRPGLLREEARSRLRQSFPTLEVVPDDVYRQLVITKHAALPADRQAPRPSNGEQPPFEQVERAVLATMDVTDGMLRDLARARAERVKAMLVADRGVDAARIDVAVPEGDAIDAPEPQASLTVR